MSNDILQELTQDIAFRLRVQSSILRNLWYGNDDLNIYDEAANEIERLRLDNRDLLRVIQFLKKADEAQND